MDRVLYIGPKEKEAIDNLVKYAEANRISFSEMKELMDGKKPPMGDNPDYICYLTNGYRVVYSIEEQPLGWCRHISISVDTPKKMPSIPAVETIMHEFGFTGTIADCISVWVENDVDVIGVGPVHAANALQKYEAVT